MENATNQAKSVKKQRGVRYLVQMAVLIAILLILEATGLGLIKLFVLEFTIMQVPVIIGAIIMGPLAGTILGTAFGLISFWECFGKSAIGVVLLGINPIGTFVTCVVARALMGLLCGLIFKALHRVDKTKWLSFGLAGLCGALLNTVFFMGFLVLFFYNSAYIQGFVEMLGTSNPFSFVLAFVGVQGLLEAVICCVVGAAVSRALYKSLHL